MPLRGDLYDYESLGPPPAPDCSVGRAYDAEARLRHVYGCWACDVAYTRGEGAFCALYLRMGWIAERREMER